MSPSLVYRCRTAVGVLALTSVVALGTTVVLTRDDSGSAPHQGSQGAVTVRGDGSLAEAVKDTAVSWPEDGQTAVKIEGESALGVRGEQQPVPVASLAKVMTAYVILTEHPLRPDEQGPLIAVDQQAANEVGVGGESTVPVRPGDTFSQRHMLELLLIPSGNNIARLLARWDSGTQEAFVEKMQSAARELSMDHSTYTGASGIEETTRSTATDQLKLAQQVMKNPVFRDIVASRTVTVPRVGPVRNTNSLLGTSDVIGLKTGSSTPAGGNLLWASEMRIGDKNRLMLGAVLHQQANTTAGEGLRAALDNSRVLIDGLRSRLSSLRSEG